MFRSSVSICFFLVVASTTLAADTDVELPTKLKTVAETVARLHAAGNVEGIWHALVPGVVRAKPEMLAAFNQALDDHKLPPVGELLAEARLGLILQDRTAALPVPDLYERLLLWPALGRNVAAALEKMEQHPILGGKALAPRSVEEYERRFEEIGGLFEILEKAEASAVYGLEVVHKIPSASKKKLTDDEQEAIAACDQGVLDSVRDAERNLFEVKLEAHLARLEYGIKVLEKPALTKERFIVAASTLLDANTVLRQLELRAVPNPSGAVAAGPKSSGTTASGTLSGKKTTTPKGAPNSTKLKGKGSKKVVAAPPPPPPLAFKRPALTRDGLANDVKAQKEKAEKLAGPLAQRSTWFFEGLQWWVRGRYGSGPELNGLAKSAGVLDDPNLLMQVGLPRELPTVLSTGSSVRQPITHADRRHHYTWAWEDRKLVVTVQAGSRREIKFFSRQQFTRQGVATNFWGNGFDETDSATIQRTVQLPAQDPLLVYRIVGFVEYERAVVSFDKFINNASIAEFEIGEQIILDQDALAIETNLSRSLEPSAGPLSERSENPRDDYKRRGLAWILAVARVELGAMLAGFTLHSTPFSVFAPKTFKVERVKTLPYGTAEYAEVLLDGLRTHYWALMNDRAVQNYYKAGVPEEHLMTHSRRANLGQAFLRAVREQFGIGVTGDAADSQKAVELNRWEQAFQKLQRVMLYCLSKKVGQERTVVYEHLVYCVERTGTPYGVVDGVAGSRERSPDVTTRWLETIDPTLVGCPCR